MSGGPGRPPRLEVYARLRTQIQELDQNLGGLPRPAEAQGIWKDIWHQEAHHSTAIEGNTLILKEVTALLEEGLAVGDKELKEYMEVAGTRTLRSGSMEPGRATLTMRPID